MGFHVKDQEWAMDTTKRDRVNILIYFIIKSNKINECIK